MRPQLSHWLLAIFTCWGLCACDRAVSRAELKPHVIERSGPNWLFVHDERKHIDFDAHEAHLMSEWLVTHQDGWESASIKDFDTAKTQLLTAKCAIEIDGDRIVLRCETDQKKDPDSTIYIKRSLSSDEQSFWSRTIAHIETPNQSPQPTAR
jgi:hypothetical protein